MKAGLSGQADIALGNGTDIRHDLESCCFFFARAVRSFCNAGYGSALMGVVFLIVPVFNVVMNRMRLSARDV